MGIKKHCLDLNATIPSAPNTLLGSVFRYLNPTAKPLAEGIGVPQGCHIFELIWSAEVSIETHLCASFPVSKYVSYKRRHVEISCESTARHFNGSDRTPGAMEYASPVHARCQFVTVKNPSPGQRLTDITTSKFRIPSPTTLAV